MYSRPSTSHTRAPSARETTNGVVATPRATYRSGSAITSALRDVVAIALPSGDIGCAPFAHSVVPARCGHALEERRRVERLRADHTSAFPGAVREQLECEHGIDRGLPHHSLCPVLPHRLLVVGDVVQVDAPLRTVLVDAGDERPRARLARHPLAEAGRVREDGRDEVTGCDLGVADAEALFRVQPEQVQSLQHFDELVAEP